MLRFIALRQQADGYAPTIREIGIGLGIRSTYGVVCHLRLIENKGLIETTSTTARSIQLTRAGRKALGLPLKRDVNRALDEAIEWLEHHGAAGAGSDDEEGLVDLLSLLRETRGAA